MTAPPVPSPRDGPGLLDALRAAPVDALDAPLRQELAVAWAQDARAEHASVGSFARFTLQLLAVGAPPDLLDRSQIAARDEITHARLCFALASRLAGQPLGPGPLPLHGDLVGGLDLASVLASTAIEGAVGETLAALRAREAATQATVPAVRVLQERIFEDEARHAELAWQTLAWGLGQSDPACRSAIAAAFARGLRDARDAPDETPEDRAPLLAWGRLGRESIRRVHQKAIDRTLGPAIAALGLG
jgi:hypothetical protein